MKDGRKRHYLGGNGSDDQLKSAPIPNTIRIRDSNLFRVSDFALRTSLTPPRASSIPPVCSCPPSSARTNPPAAPRPIHFPSPSFWPALPNTAAKPLATCIPTSPRPEIFHQSAAVLNLRTTACPVVAQSHPHPPPIPVSPVYTFPAAYLQPTLHPRHSKSNSRRDFAREFETRPVKGESHPVSSSPSGRAF